MRLIGHFVERTLAERASRVFAARGIGHQLEENEGGRGWGLWVLSEEELERARELYAAFLRAPNDPRFDVVSGGGESGAKEAAPAAARKEARARADSGPTDDHPRPGMGGATLLITALCLAVAFVTALGANREWVERLLIAGLPYRLGAAWDLFLPEVRKGEVWRLLTPMLLHFGWPHILFNLLSFWGLGNAIEFRRGTLALVGLVVAFALFSNLGQYFARGPGFGGLSGVVYGLLGYVWMMGRYRPQAGLVLQPQMVLMMLVWFAICANGSLDTPYGRGADGVVRPAQQVANAAHGMGLLAGMAWGRWAAWRAGQRARLRGSP